VAGMTVAELVARLRADTSQFQSGMRQAENSLNRFDSVTSGTMRGMARFGQQVSEIASGVALATAGAMTSLGAVGVQYNTLMQRTTAAFSVLLGSAEKANGMVGELTEFARSSPFPRQLFIEGAQQLIGFGMAARDVVPAFSAIQDAVAAVGGGSAEIQTFTNIFARIKSLGRANSEELMRFSLVGIDAFKLLADQAGTSTSEMRKRITEGTLGADEAIRLLTEGLSKKFEGAAAQVKNTWVGAVDRVKGAWRDIGSALMSPFIDPKGGGAAVRWANQLADLLRKLESQAVIPLAAKMRDFFDMIGERTDAINFDDWIQKAVDLWHEYGKVLTDILPLIAGVAVGFTKQGLAMLPVISNFANFLPLPGKLVGAFVGLLLSTEDGRQALSDLGDTLSDGLGQVLPTIVPLVADLTRKAAELLVPLVKLAQVVIDIAFPILADGVMLAGGALSALLTILTPLTEFLAEHPAIVQAIVAAWAAWEIMSLVRDFMAWRTALIQWSAAVTAAKVASSGAAGAIGSVGAQMGTAAVGGSRLLTTVGKIGPAIGSAMATGIPQVALLTYAFMENEQRAADATAGAEEFVQAATADIDTTSLEGIAKGFEAIAKARRDLNVNPDMNPGMKGSILDDILGRKNEYEQAVDAITAANVKLVAQSAMAELGLATFAKQAGVNVSVAKSLARIHQVDLSGSLTDVTGRLNETWEALKANGDEEKVLADSMGLTVAAYRHKQRLIDEMVPSLRQMERETEALTNANGAFANSTTVAFSGVANEVLLLGETYAETIAQADQAVQGFLNPLETWGAAQAQVSERISTEHATFVDDLRSQHENLMDSYRAQWERLDSEGRIPFEQWVEVVKGSSTAFDEWAARINGVSLEEFKAEFDEAGMAFTEFLDLQDKKLSDLQAWADNIKKIGERGGGALAIEIAKWGPEAATLVGQIANSTEPEWERWLSQQNAILGASTDALIMEMGLQALIGANGGAKTVAGIETALGLMPGKVKMVAEKARSDFGFVMDALAIVAASGGTMSANNLATTLADQLGKDYPSVLAMVQAYADLFNDLGVVITRTSAAWQRPGVPVYSTMSARERERYGLADGGILQFANGGVLGAVQSFANGGENHMAQIAKAGAMRMWAEPETGGEAYIPLARAKRERSMSILAKVAEMFGYGLAPLGMTDFGHGGFFSRSGGNGGPVSGGGGSVGSPTYINIVVNGRASAEDADEVVKSLVEWSRANGAIPVKVTGG
jgi:tape measure domain-containing protein